MKPAKKLNILDWKLYTFLSFCTRLMEYRENFTRENLTGQFCTIFARILSRAKIKVIRVFLLQSNFRERTPPVGGHLS